MKRLVSLVAFVLSVALASAAWATENGAAVYPDGAEGFMTGAVPPPGQYLVNYALYQKADKFVMGDGPDNDSFDLEVYGDVLRFINVTDIKILGAHWAQHIFIPVLHVDVSTDVPNPLDPTGPPINIRDDKTGLGDLIVDPFILAWHSEKLHCAAGLDIYVPVGAYDEQDLANVGRNYWALQPVFAFTYLPGSGCELSAKLMYDINLENDDTDYDSGDAFHVDYTVGKKVDALTLGVGGFYYKQLTGDSAPDMAPTMDRAEQIAVGPQVAWQCDKMTFIMKYHHAVETENRPESNTAWFKFITPF